MENIATIWAMEAKNALREAAAAGKQTEQALKLVIPQGRDGHHHGGGGKDAGHSKFSIPGASQVASSTTALRPGQAASPPQAASISQGSFFKAMQNILRQQYKQQLQQQQSVSQTQPLQQQNSNNQQHTNLNTLQTLLSQLALLQNPKIGSTEKMRGFFS